MKTPYGMKVGDGFVQPPTTTVGADTAEAKYRRHLSAIFHGPCTCEKWWCLGCWSRRWRHDVGTACPRHDDTCPACIAEHALYCAGDHEAVASGESQE